MTDWTVRPSDLPLRIHSPPIRRRALGAVAPNAASASKRGTKQSRTQRDSLRKDGESLPAFTKPSDQPWFHWFQKVPVWRRLTPVWSDSAMDGPAFPPLGPGFRPIRPMPSKLDVAGSSPVSRSYVTRSTPTRSRWCASPFLPCIRFHITFGQQGVANLLNVGLTSP